MILVDAGPLAALINRRDRHHASCRATFASIEGPIGTVWPVLTEAMYLVRSSHTAHSALWQVILRGTVSIMRLDVDDAPRMHELMEKYHDLPMDLADAALVRVAEREKVSRIFTLDRRDFNVYRPMGVGRFSILPS